ncbi:endolytic transglycosylase MltG [Brucella anthropi]|uniref:Endolytic murein transglycosylase n=1 Tax=Brucella anthropi (strain ATCC 49188 / DSM 6882 / CCUG 24695 / JCM 21032 / LMG 3331 / NBRC 15819 / NCTC 12168 / Alc 37) TaxID=439375 RepID=A6WWF1_BRUA4|nr:endolytic transglycosylase MltG [Brucella anthropi]ABS13305.1 aminodeoxychorismate lyase [Brucella anthropi ATCC 49188]AIK43737.1 yceG-like family protein [Brucella anthropi]KAB2734518.1 endolytic transglycosylase MltG [Brucella anthropi]KAB2749648.1 endolytic transglycosylase MltG [Brucella anthropi]KAB2764038.1 endolytic transglycosylase MltG [Brucella anthropi]
MNSEAPSGTPPADELPKGVTQETNATSKPFVPKSASEALRPEPGTPPPSKRSRHARSQIVVFMNFMLSLVVLVLLGASALFYFGKMQFDGQGPLTAETTFLVKRGAGIAEVSNSLENREIVSDARIFRYGMRTLGHENDLKAGEYAIPAGASMRDVMNILISGKSIMYPLTIPEGLTVKQIFDRISADPTLVGDMPKDMPPEGSLFTDTLNFTRGTTRSEIIDRMVASQKKLVDDAWAKRGSDLPIKDKNEFVTLASIVEKETGIASERPHVASVFVNRLKKGMRIQSDPTIIYGLFGGAGKPSDRPIFKSDIEKPTPYNTYVINGLPPTPIANPGKAALEAVANPLDTEDLYFVADGTGGHVFSKTLQEHNANVRKWRSVEQQKNIEQQNNSGSNTNQSAGQ